METGMAGSSRLCPEGEQTARFIAPGSPKAPSPAMRKLENAAREFEGILLASVWQAWNKSDRMGNQHDPIGESMRSMGIEMASIAMAEKGGIGIARMIVKSLEREVTGQSGK